MVGDNVKASQEWTSGILRYMADSRPSWDIRFFTGSETRTPQDWTRKVVQWRPNCIVATTINVVKDMMNYLPTLPRTCKIVSLASGDEAKDAMMPPRTVFVGVADNEISAAAFELMCRRGIGHFAYVHTGEASDILRSRRRAAEFKCLVERAGFDFTESCAGLDGDWTKRLSTIASDLSSLPLPCGVMAYNDRCAREVMDACNLVGLAIPSQIQVVGVDDQHDICENMRPRLTSIVPDFEGLGYLIAQRMNELLTTGKAKKMSICGVKRIAERETTLDLSGAARLVTSAEKHIRAYACQGLPPSPKGLTPSSLAEALNVSRRYLEIRFKKVRGEGIAEAIRRHKIAEVCRMLKETDLPIGEIAARCGFPVPTYLNALFRRAFGTTLRDYRAAHQPSKARGRQSRASGLMPVSAEQTQQRQNSPRAPRQP